MLWDEISMVWNFNAILSYGKCCNRYAWTDNECVVCLHLLEKKILFHESNLSNKCACNRSGKYMFIGNTNIIIY